MHIKTPTLTRFLCHCNRHTTTLGTLKALTCFFENVTSDHLAPTSALLAVILDILAVIVEMQAALQPESPYIAQLLMNALGTVAIRAAVSSSLYSTAHI